MALYIEVNLVTYMICKEEKHTIKDWKEAGGQRIVGVGKKLI